MLYDLCTGLFLLVDWGIVSSAVLGVSLGEGSVHSLVHTIDAVALKRHLETV